MSFSTSIAKWSQAASELAERRRRAIIVKLSGAIIQDTPVLSGRLRGNWQFSVGSPVVASLADIRSGEAAQAEAGQVAEALIGDQTFYGRNNLPYAARVEYEGWSHTKAPAGMMRKNLVRFDTLLRQEQAGHE